MNRIKRKHSNKDRVVCVSIPGKQWFYFFQNSILQ